jgi:hypothetical protein
MITLGDICPDAAGTGRDRCRPGEEDLVLRAARAFERERPWAQIGPISIRLFAATAGISAKTDLNLNRSADDRALSVTQFEQGI